MNRKGQLGFGLVVLGALVLVVTALFSISSFNSNVEKLHKDFSEVHFSFEFQEEYAPYLADEVVSTSLRLIKERGFDLERSFNEAIKEVATGKRSSKVRDNFIAKVVEEDYEFIDEGAYYVLKVNDVLISNSKNFNEVRKTFNIAVRFNKDNVLRIDVQ